MARNSFHTASMIAKPRFLLRIAALASLTALAAACSERPAPPPPAPAPETPPPPRPAPVPQTDWRQDALTQGDWSWSMQAGRSTARYGTALTMRCDSPGGTVTFQFPGRADGRVPVSVHTSATSRSLSASPSAGGAQALEFSLPARDPLLDAMAFSRGRFAIAVTGLPMLIVPSWPEVSRVIEDCR